MPRKSDTKQRLLDTALELVWAQSYGAVSVEDICARADARKGSFYHYFPSKAALAAAALEAHWLRLQPALDCVFSPQRPPLERLARFCELVAEGQAGQLAKAGKICGCPYSAIGSELSTQDDTLRGKAEEFFDRHCRYLASALRDATRDGSLPLPCRDPAGRARELYSFVVGVALQAKLRNDLRPLHSLKAGFFRLLGFEREPKQKRLVAKKLR